MVICILEINFASHSPGCNIVWMLCSVFIFNAVITFYPSRQYKSIADWKDPSLSGTKKKLPQNPIFDISKRLFIAPDINAPCCHMSLGYSWVVTHSAETGWGSPDLRVSDLGKGWFSFVGSDQTICISVLDTRRNYDDIGVSKTNAEDVEVFQLSGRCQGQ